MTMNSKCVYFYRIEWSNKSAWGTIVENPIRTNADFNRIVQVLRSEINAEDDDFFRITSFSLIGEEGKTDVEEKK